MKNCLECGSLNIIKNAQVFDRGDGDGKRDFEVYFDIKPDALIFKERTYHKIKAEICGDCGYVHFFVVNPATLWQTYQKQQKGL